MMSISILARREKIDKKELLKLEKVGVVQVVEAFLVFLCFFGSAKSCLTNFSDKLTAWKAKKV